MEVIDDVTAFRKLKKKAEYNDIVCVEDLFSSYKIQLQENTQEQFSTKEFINHHFPNREFILKEKNLTWSQQIT